MEFDTFLIIVAVVVVLLFTGIGFNRRGGVRMQSRMCRACGAAHPPFAQFCRRCGQRLQLL